MAVLKTISGRVGELCESTCIFQEETGAARSRKDRWCHAGLPPEPLPLVCAGMGAGDRLRSFSRQRERSWLYQQLSTGGHC